MNRRTFIQSPRIRPASSARHDEDPLSKSHASGLICYQRLLVMTIRTHFLLIGILTATALQAAGPPPDPALFETKAPWVPNPDLVASQNKRRPESNFDESKVPAWTLPPLLEFSDGTSIKTAEDWSRRRAELLGVFQSEMFGVSPPRPEGLAFEVVETDPRAMNGAATLKRIAIRFPLAGETFTFHLILFVPNARSQPAPVFLQINHRGVENTDPTRQTPSGFWPAEEVIARGYAIAAINVAAEVDPDNFEATQTNGVRAFFRRHHPEASAFTWGTLAAWGWAGSRGVDYFQTDPDLDASRIALVGHSRTGKAALWAAARDDRFALVCVNGAGEGGPSLARRHFGETLGQVTRNFKHWFTPRYASYADRITELPVDSHQLIALIAPRAYHGGDAADDLWADPRGAWLALVEASKVWPLHGKTEPLQDIMPQVNDLLIHGPLAYHIRAAGHDLTPFDWKLYLDHADTLWPR
jgi:dienelactone hydrolase